MEPDAMVTTPDETRWTFRGYAIATAAAGLLLFGWGPLLLSSGVTHYSASLIRAAGGVLMAAACFAWPLGSIVDAADARRALIGFGAGHVVLFLVLLTQQVAIWNSRRADALLTGILFVGFVFLYTKSGIDTRPPENAGLTTLSILSNPRPSVESLRRRYRHEIREAALAEERHRLARDLHDSVKQQIFAIQTSAAAVQVRFEADPAGARAALEQVRASAREAMAEMEAMLDQLRAAPLESGGLVASLRQQCEALGFRTGADIVFEPGELPNAQALAPGAQEALFRIAQEALSNIGRHARASRVKVTLGVVANHLHLTVEDNGSGFDPSQPARGMGMANMRSRAAEFGGTFDIAGCPGEGTRVQTAIPLDAVHDLAEYNRRLAWFAVGSVAQFAIAVWRDSSLFAMVATFSVVYLIRTWRLRSRAKRELESRR